LLGVDGEARELIEKYNAGLFFVPENKTDFLEKLMLLYSDKALFKKCADGGQALAKEYSREKWAGEMLEVIREHLSPP